MRITIALVAILAVGCIAHTGPSEEKKKVPVRHGPHRPLIPKKRTMVCAKDSKPAVVAVIDTGFTFSEMTKNVKLCKFGHKDFTNSQKTFLPSGLNIPVPIDNNGHGTNIVGVIQQYAGNTDYCIVVLKYYDPANGGMANLENTIKAIKYATNLHVKYINYSGGGESGYEEEKLAVKKFLDNGGRFIAAAGNERSDVQIKPYYPAMYDSRIVSVGSVKADGEPEGYSNFGKSISRWEYGTNVVGFGIMLSGTSQATAIATGKIINESECDK